MGLLPNLPKTGPDSWQGMRVAFRCMAVMGLTAGGIRSTGVMYIGIMNQFGVTRKEASWPLSILGAMLSLGGIFAGPLAQAFSPRPVIICGSLLVFIGLFLSYFAPSIAWLTFTFGLVFGSGLGTIHTINVVFLQQYFSKLRGLALGLNYAGSTTAGFIFPLLLTYLLGEFGFKGMLLIFSAILLHIFALCLMHHEAPWLKSADVDDVSKIPASQKHMDEDKTNSDTFTEVPLDKMDATEGQIQVDQSEPNAKTNRRVTLRESLSVLKIRQFWLIIVTFTLFIYAYDAYFTTIIDYIVDHGIPLLQATTIVPLYSITDMISRLTIPQLGDRGYINKKLLVAIAYAVQTGCYVLLPVVAMSGTFAPIALLAMLHSAAVGTSIVMYGVMMAESVGPARLPISYGIVGAFVGTTYFTKPYFIGYFRDTVGDYMLMYITAGLCTGISAVTWFITYLLHRITRNPSPKVEEQPKPADGGHVNNTIVTQECSYNRSKSFDEVSLNGSEGRRSRCSTMLHL